MTHYIIRRLLQSLLLLLAVTFIAFVVQRLAPGGPAQFTEDPRLPPDYAEQARRQFGLDQPIIIQYVKWVQQASRLNFGRSFQDKRPVIDKILERAPNTLILNAAALMVGLLGIPMGVIAALRRDSWLDHSMRAFMAVLSAIPHWWLALVLLILMVKTGFTIVPLGGMYTPGQDSILNRLRHLIFPAIMAGTGSWIGFSRYMRSELLEVIQQDYVRTARAKGLSERVVLYRHALRNAMIVMVTILSASFLSLLGGSILFENVFSWPGMGRLFIEAANARDYPVLMGLVVIGSAIAIFGTLLTDILYGYVDPRIKFS